MCRHPLLYIHNHPTIRDSETSFVNQSSNINTVVKSEKSSEQLGPGVEHHDSRF